MMQESFAWTMLTTRSIQWPLLPSGYGHLTPADVAGMLGGLPRRPYLLGLAAFVGDLSCIDELEALVHITVARTAGEQEWEIPHGKDYCRKMGQLALFELLIRVRCTLCKGRRHLPRSADEFHREHCPRCEGTGRIKPSTRRRAEYAGIDQKVWLQTWAKRYEAVVAELSGWQCLAERHLKRQLFAEAA